MDSLIDLREKKSPSSYEGSCSCRENLGSPKSIDSVVERDKERKGERGGIEAEREGERERERERERMRGKEGMRGRRWDIERERKVRRQGQQLDTCFQQTLR